jgi:hypothetical protein
MLSWIGKCVWIGMFLHQPLKQCRLWLLRKIPGAIQVAHTGGGSGSNEGSGRKLEHAAWASVLIVPSSFRDKWMWFIGAAEGKASAAMGVKE